MQEFQAIKCPGRARERFRQHVTSLQVGARSAYLSSCKGGKNLICMPSACIALCESRWHAHAQVALKMPVHMRLIACLGTLLFQMTCNASSFTTAAQNSTPIHLNFTLTHLVCVQDAFTSLELCRWPVLAAVHGACVGAGVDLITVSVRYIAIAA